MQALKNANSFELLFIIFASLFILGCGGGGSTTTPPSTPSAVSLSSLNFNTIETNLKTSEAVQITVTGTYSDGSTRDLTSLVNWESSNTDVASISNTGELVGISVGSTSISASLDSITTSLVITVSPANLQSITISFSTTQIPLGLTASYAAEGLYSDGSTKDLTPIVNWMSSNSEIASISNTGELVGISVGSTTISASLDSITTSLEITVFPASLQSIIVSFSSTQIPLGLTASSTAEGLYSDGSTEDLTSLVTWTLSNPAVIEVSDNGLITGLSVGSSTVTATYEGQSFESNLVVIELIDLSISPTIVNLPLKSSIQLSVTGIYADNRSEPLDHLVTWGSANADIASITNTGEVAGLTAGSTSVSATFGSIKTSLNVTVSPASLQSIILSAATTQIPVGLDAAFTAKGVYSDGTELDITNQVLWAVTDSTIASINSESGLLTTLKTGTVSISANKEGKTSSIQVSVSPASLINIAITPTEVSLAKGSKIAINVTANYSDGTKADVSEQVTWINSNEQIAKIENNPLSVVSLKEGTTRVTASLNDQQAELLIDVTNSELISLAVYPVNPSIPLGQSQQFYAQGTFSDGVVQDLTSEVTWLSSNENRASISNAKFSEGLAETTAVGNTILTAVIGQIQQETKLTVTNAQLAHIEIVPTTLGLPKGSSAEVKALGYFSDGTSIDLTTKVIWSTSNAKALSVETARQGTLRGISQGSAVLSATIDGVVGMANVSITDSTLQSIAISAQQTTIPKGINQRLIATGTYSDLSTRDISQYVNWQSDDVRIASVSNSSNAGLLQAVSSGQVKISASLASVSSNIAINVTDTELTKIEIAIPKATINVQSTLFATAVASFTDETSIDVSSQVNWSSSQVNIAPISNIESNKGEITGLALGSSNIAASLLGIDATAIPIEVLRNPDLPQAINITVKPNIVLNDNSDAAEVNLKLIPSVENGVIADGTEITLTITEGDTTREIILATTNGSASYALASEYDGFISIAASNNDNSVNSGILSADKFEDGISVSGRGTAVYENDTLKAGSRFFLLLRNLTNRKFDINQINIGYFDPNNNNAFVNFPDSPVTSEEFTSDGNLAAGEFANIGYELDDDTNASVYVIVYVFYDEQSNTVFNLQGTFNFAQ